MRCSELGSVAGTVVDGRDGAANDVRGSARGSAQTVCLNVLLKSAVYIGRVFEMNGPFNQRQQSARLRRSRLPARASKSDRSSRSHHAAVSWQPPNQDITHRRNGGVVGSITRRQSGAYHEDPKTSGGIYSALSAPWISVFAIAFCTEEKIINGAWRSSHRNK